MRRVLILAASLLLSACVPTIASRIPPGVVVQPVIATEVIAKPCATRAGPAPVYPDTRQALNAAPNIAERAKLMAAGQAMRIAREIELTADNSGCAPPNP